MILAATALIMSLNASLLGLGQLESAFVAHHGAEVQALTEGCLEEALGQLRRNSAYSSGLLIIPNSSGSCIITVMITSPTGRTIEVVATIGEFTRNFTATVTIGVNMVVVNTWQD